MKIEKKALIGFIVVLVLTLFLAGITMYKIATIFGLYQTQKGLNSFYVFAYKVNDTSMRPVGTKESTALYLDYRSAILGFSKNSNQIVAGDTLNVVEGVLLSNPFTGVGAYFSLMGANAESFIHYSARPKECGGIDSACICFCKDYAWRYAEGAIVTGIHCQVQFICVNFTNFDLPSQMSKDDFGMEFYTKGGFILARNFMLGDKEVKARLTGIYITHESPGLVSVSYNIEGISKETVQMQKDREIVGKLMWEANNAFTSKQWDAAIAKYDEIINGGYTKYLSEGSTEAVYLFRAMCYYNKHDKENALKAFDEARKNAESQNIRDMIRQKRAEAEGW